MSIDDSFRPNKIARCTPDMFPAAIYFDSGNSVSTFKTPYEYPQVILLTYDAPDIVRIKMRDKLGHAT